MRHTTSGVIAASMMALAASGAASAQTTINVATASELRNAVSQANSAGGGATILLADGTYSLTSMLNVTAPNVTIRGASGNRDRVIIQGDAMSASAVVKVLLRTTGRDFTLRDLTLQRSGSHLLQVVGEQDADRPTVRNVVFRDAYEQMLKVSIDPANPGVTSDAGIVEGSLFEYSAGIGPQYYIGGIDAHGSRDWVVRGNVFKSIASPSQTIAEHAIHFWNGSANALVERNTILNCDRGIGFGLGDRGNNGGVIRNNFVTHVNPALPFADVGILLETSPGTQVYNNTVLLETAYPRSIEYRFTASSGLVIGNNLANKPIGARDGATATLFSNVVSADRTWFTNAGAGDLHLASALGIVVDQGRAVTGLVDDIDSQSRVGSAPDIGADEWQSATAIQPPTNLHVAN